MTATEVNGVAVVATEPVLSPMSRPGKPIPFTRIVRLLLADDAELHGCTECVFTDPSLGKVRNHLKDHKKTSVPDGLADLTVAELIERAGAVGARAGALERMTESRNEWKTRAQRAERAAADREQWRARALDAEKRLDLIRKGLS